jgi:DNA polymerase III alpha subunit
MIPKGVSNMQLNQEILQYIEAHQQEAFDLLVEMAQIPAPSNHEEKRAAFCKEWLEKQGAQGVYIDEALNVIWPVGCTGNNPLMVFMAHSDVVFPDTEELPLVVEDGKIRLPFNALKGLGDNAAKALYAASQQGAYTSADEIISRAGVGQSIVDLLRSVGALGDMPATSQMTLFGF